MDRKLLEVAEALLAEDGWAAVNLDRIAAAAGVSRATVWRHGFTRAAVERELRRRLADDCRDLLWPALTMPGDAAARLRACLEALCELSDRHLALLSHSDQFLHEAELHKDGEPVNMLEPLVTLLNDGRRDGSIVGVGDPWPYAAMLCSAVVLPYVHLRAHHAEWGWTPERTRRYVLGLAADGYLPR
ncbi:TetR/AcrR family transcriptional regulator [Flindersiella endophytica]